MNSLFQSKMDEIDAEKKKVKSQKLYTWYDISETRFACVLFGFVSGLLFMYFITRL